MDGTITADLSFESIRVVLENEKWSSSHSAD
jgi:hypothetical protein